LAPPISPLFPYTTLFRSQKGDEHQIPETFCEQDHLLHFQTSLSLSTHRVIVYVTGTVTIRTGRGAMISFQRNVSTNIYSSRVCMAMLTIWVSGNFKNRDQVGRTREAKRQVRQDERATTAN